MSDDPRLLAIGVASPAARLSRAAGLRLAQRISPETEHPRLAQLYDGAGVSERGSILGDDGDGADLLETADPRGPDTPARLARYLPHAAPLAEAAAANALTTAEKPADAVTHLITVSCTGAESPGLDHALIERLGLRPEVSRTHVGFMGCHGAINGLALADAFVRARPGALAMVVCAEICSLHFQARAPWDQQVANAIFADGAACAIVGAAADRPDAPRLRAFGSRVFPGTADLMAWTIGAHGFEMRLSPRVPGVLRRAVGPWTDAWLGALGLSRARIAAWAVHPGGRDILAAVERGLALPDHALDPSRRILDRHGNMSSGTVLWVLDELLRAGTAGIIGALSFGPGLTGEGLLIETG